MGEKREKNINYNKCLYLLGILLTLGGKGSGGVLDKLLDKLSYEDKLQAELS